MSNFNIKKAWPVAVATAGLALVGQVQAAGTGLPVPGVYTSALIGAGTSYYLQVGAHYGYTPSTTAAAPLTYSVTSALIAVDLKSSSTASTWNFSLTTNPLGSPTANTATLTSTWNPSTTTQCTLTYELTQDYPTQVLSLAAATVTKVTLTSTKAATSTDTAACNTSFNSRTGIVMPQTGAQTYSLIF